MKVKVWYNRSRYQDGSEPRLVSIIVSIPVTANPEAVTDIAREKVKGMTFPGTLFPYVGMVHDAEVIT